MRPVVMILKMLVSGFAAALACSSEFTYSQSRAKKQETFPASIHSKWDSVFEFKKGWTGGDGAGTVDLGDGRILWMFGDSFIGEIAKGKHAAGSHMVNNAIAIQTIRDRSAPQQKDFQFAWGPDDSNKKPTAWLVPEPKHVRPSAPIKNEKHPHGWYWPAGGGTLLKSNERNKLVLFLFHVGSTGEQGVWSFKNIGGAMAVVENPHRPIKQWRVRQLDLPFSIDRDQIEKDRSLKETTWGMACLTVEPSKQDQEQPYVYIYGTRQQTRFNRHLIVARVRASEIEQFSKWKFYAGQEQGADATTRTGISNWTRDVDRAATVADGMAVEFSVEPIMHQGKRKYVMVQSHSLLGTRIFVRTAELPEGPWSKPLAVYDVPDVKKSKNYFTYAGKGHAKVSGRDHLLITYVVNSQDFWEMCGDASIYRPRVISVPLKIILEKSK